jgi:predicted transcriptional regulator
MRQARNPLTKEKLVVRDVINEIVDSDRYDVLYAAKRLPQPTTRSEIADYSNVSRQTTSNHIAVLNDRGFVKSHESGIEITAGGKVLAESIKDCLDTLGRGELAYLSRSDYAIETLLTIYETNSRASDLPHIISGEPSRSTIGRVLDSIDSEYEWTTEDSNILSITSDGKEALIAYDELEKAVEQLIEKADWLQRLPPGDATFPVHELEDACVIASDTGKKAKTLWRALNLCDLRTSRFRCVVSIYNPVLFNVYKMMLDMGIEAESVIDWETFNDIRREQETSFAADESLYENYQPRYLDYAHTLGIGLYDDRKVAVGAYNKVGDGKEIAMIVSTNDALIEWATELYDHYRSESKHPSEAATNTSGQPSAIAE